MREILFRGQVKDKDELIGKGFTIGGTVNPISEWVYGVPIPRYPDLFLAWSEGNGEYEEITVIPETVGQYTGLKDLHGTRIFENGYMIIDDKTYKVIFDTAEYILANIFNCDIITLKNNSIKGVFVDEI